VVTARQPHSVGEQLAILLTERLDVQAPDDDSANTLLPDDIETPFRVLEKLDIRFNIL